MPGVDPARVRAVLDAVSEGQVLADDQMSLLLRAYARPGMTVEDDRLDLKESFADDKTGWANLCRQVVALHNSGGGLLLFGVGNDGARVGLSVSLLRILDPANVNNQLTARRAPAVLRTTYTELRRYNKVFGFLAVRGGNQIVVFDQDVQGRDGRTVCQAGCVYARRNGQSAPATFAEIQAMSEKIVARGVQGFLARVDRIASLPASAQLIAANPGSQEGFLLTARGEGVPVQVIGPEEGAPSVTLSEEILPDTPLSAPSLEVANQVRQWRTDPNHRVTGAVLRRWYQERANIDVPGIRGAAELLLLSALRENSLPIHYWAAQVDKAALRCLMQDLISRDPYPERLNVPYVVGAFLWDERETLLAPHLGRHQGYDKVHRASSHEQFVLNGRSPSEVFTLPSGSAVRFSADVLSDVSAAAAIFDACLAAGDTYIQAHRSHLHQLDLFLHAGR